MSLVPSQSSSPRDREGTASLWERPLKAGMLAGAFGHWAEVSSPSSGARAAQDTAWTFEIGVFFQVVVICFSVLFCLRAFSPGCQFNHDCVLVAGTLGMRTAAGGYVFLIQ